MNISAVLADTTVEVAYCHSPTRYLWDWTDQYLNEEVPAVLHRPVRELLTPKPRSLVSLR